MSFFKLQDANECWIQMMRVLQQKLEAIEDDSVKEVIDMFVIIDFHYTLIIILPPRQKLEINLS